jgi:predicted Rossmann fold flavoprotein
MYDIVIVGAGASGLLSATLLARRGKRVLILEKNSRVGKKLLATGNGRCNITNIKPTPNRFHSQNNKFISQVLNGYSYHSIREFFKSIGLELIEGKEGRVFPISLQASSVVELLEYSCRESGVEIVCGIEVKRVERRRESFNIISNDERFKSRELIIATGNLSAPQLGGVEDGLKFAKSFGHKIIKPYPTLVQLTSNMKNLKKIAGVKVDSEVSLRLKSGVVKRRGDILFTNYGISGLAILDISRVVVEELKTKREVTLYIDLMPRFSREQLLSMMRKSIRKKGTKPIDIWLKGFINKKLIAIILSNLNFKNLIERDITINHLDKIVREIKSFRFIVDGDRGFKGAEVASGGVDTREIEPKTMESKRVKGLYFTGEVLDIDGDRGGFNLHFAWVCGMRVGSPKRG